MKSILLNERKAPPDVPILMSEFGGGGGNNSVVLHFIQLLCSCFIKTMHSLYIQTVENQDDYCKRKRADCVRFLRILYGVAERNASYKAGGRAVNVR